MQLNKAIFGHGCHSSEICGLMFNSNPKKPSNAGHHEEEHRKDLHRGQHAAATENLCEPITWELYVGGMTKNYINKWAGKVNKFGKAIEASKEN